MSTKKPVKQNDNKLTNGEHAISYEDIGEFIMLIVILAFLGAAGYLIGNHFWPYSPSSDSLNAQAVNFCVGSASETYLTETRDKHGEFVLTPVQPDASTTLSELKNCLQQNVTN